MALNHFTFGDFQSLKDCGLYIEKRPAPQKPVRDVTAHQVPGRDGDVLIDNGRWNSVTVKYQVGCSDIDANIDKINQMLCQTGFQNLRDTYDPEVYRKACCINAMEFQEDLLNFGHATIEFSCDPYRYLISGNSSITATVTSDTVIENPTGFTALPRIYLVATPGATCTIHLNSNNYPVAMPSNRSSLYIDSESMNAYVGNTNFNDALLFDEFPVLEPGETTVQLTTSSGTIRALIIPRWRKI